MKTLKTTIVAAAAATAMAVSATPAMAKQNKHRGGPSAGEVIAGAVVLGGLAAILTSGKKDRYSNDYRYDNGRYNRGKNYRHSNHGYGDRIKPRKAVNKCVRAAERRAGHYGQASVTDIRDVKRTRYGYRIKGRVAVNKQYRGRHYRSNYDRGYNRDQRRGYGERKFTCYVEGRRVSDLRIKGFDNRR